ncbi:MAG: hypothetical protein JO116_16045 [Planctomycetaceae bacterium]|nr:hypothetical protein [Planctomycetaceae bacterium]
MAVITLVLNLGTDLAKAVGYVIRDRGFIPLGTLRRWQSVALAVSLVAVSLVAWQIAISAQQPAPAPTRGRFEFQVTQSFDAKYLGDTPGHVGRGTLQGARPDVSLGDPVYRGTVRIGMVTGLTWDRSKENLEVEFDPEPFEIDPHGRPTRRVRISVGQDVWIPLGGEAPVTTAH